MVTIGTYNLYFVACGIMIIIRYVYDRKICDVKSFPDTEKLVLAVALMCPYTPSYALYIRVGSVYRVHGTQNYWLKLTVSVQKSVL